MKTWLEIENMPGCRMLKPLRMMTMTGCPDLRNLLGSLGWPLLFAVSTSNSWSELNMRPLSPPLFGILVYFSSCLTVTSLLFTWQWSALRVFNPLSPNSDQHQFSSISITHNEKKRLWDSIKWSPEGKCFDLLTNSLNEFEEGKYEDQSGELALKGFLEWTLM